MELDPRIALIRRVHSDRASRQKAATGPRRKRSDARGLSQLDIDRERRKLDRLERITQLGTQAAYSRSALKEELTEAARAGVPIATLARASGVSHVTIRKWRDAAA